MNHYKLFRGSSQKSRTQFNSKAALASAIQPSMEPL